MHDVIRQLQAIARAARRMLVAQVVARFAAVAIVALIVAGLVDFQLRLPGWVRLTIMVGLGAAAAAWLSVRLARAARFAPTPATLALRAEALFPPLRHLLASGVEFAQHPEAYADPQRTAAFALAAIQRGQAQLPGVNLRRLIDPTPTLRAATLLALAGLLAGAIVIAAPAASVLAMQRWFAPLGEAQWPRRTGVASLVRHRVWPTDTPLRFEAAVHMGYRPGMRAWVHYRVRDAAGDDDRAFRGLLMNDQQTSRSERGAGRFERLLDVTELSTRLAAAAGAQRWGERRVEQTIDFYMAAGDDRTPVQTITLVERPAVTAVAARIEPPAYARGLVDDQQVALGEQTGPLATASGLAGSAVTLSLAFNKPMKLAGGGASVLPGLPAPDDNGTEAIVADRLERRFVLDRTVQTTVELIDGHGLRNVSERVYRLEAYEDKPPAASLVQPVADESVLATAVIDVEAAGQDDVGLEELALEVQAPVHETATASGTVNVAQPARRQGRSPRLTLTHRLDLAPMSLQPGDVVVLTAIAQDVFAMNGDDGQLQRREPVRSASRTLRIVDAPDLIAQVRNELATMRQQAIRMETVQRQLLDSPAAEALVPQQQLERRVESQQDVLEAIRDRLARNRLDEPQLNQTLGEADRLLEQAREASAQAAGQLQQAAAQPDAPQALRQREQARQQQERSRDALGQLIAALDQGRDALTLQLNLRQMMTQQEQAADDTRRLLPQTAGLRPEDLPAEAARGLEDLADRQQALSRQAEELARQMQAAADALQRQSESDQDQAAAQALREAAAIAQRQGLASQMQRAAASAQQNRLSEAGQQQLGAMDTMQQMMSALGSQQQKQMEMLRRRLAALAEQIQRLIQQQNAQLARLDEAAAGAPVAPMEDGVAILRRNTIAVEVEANKSERTQPAGELLGRAGLQQGEAILALRAEQRDPASAAQRQSLAFLEEALRRVQQVQEQAEQEMTDQQREELEQAYRKLAGQQKQIRDQTAALTGVDGLNRRQRAELQQLGHAQSDLQIAAAELREKVEDTLVFVQTHRRIDESAARVTRQLRAAQSDADVLFEQQMIQTRLLAMADAIRQQRQDEQQFRQQQQQQQQGGGGGGPPPPLIPPVAELKLIRGLQESVYQQTRRLHGSADVPDRRERLLDLSVQQRELSDLGTRLIEKVKNAQ